MNRWGHSLAGSLGVVLLFSASTLPLAQAAERWWHEAKLSIKAHDHQFYRVTANSIQCEVRVRLHFDAPLSRYQGAAANENTYRFIAQIKLSGGEKFVSKAMRNREPGPRVFSFSHDSQFDGCWAERPHRLRKVNVHSCRGAQCVPRGFD